MRTRCLVVLALLAALAPAASAQAADVSPGIERVRTVPERGIVSAKAAGSLLYVSAVGGVSIYDIADPRRPRRIGRLALPNSQNEDVDVAGGILLVSDEAFVGSGTLHVVDVRDPRRPRVLSRYSTWRPIGIADSTRRGGIGHTATCIQDCRWAWLAGSDEGVEVVDLRDPARPRFAGKLPLGAATGLAGTHDVQVDSTGLAWVAGGGGTAAYEVGNPARPRLRVRTDRRGARGPWNNLIHHNSLRTSASTLLLTEEDLKPGCRRAGSFQTWAIGDAGRARPLDRFAVERNGSARLLCSAHYFDHRDGLVAAGFYEQGVRFLRVDDPRRITQVGYYIADPAMVWGALYPPTDPTGAVVYVLDHAKGIDVLDLDRAALRPVRRPDRPRQGRGGLDVTAVVDDDLDVARPGQRLRIGVAAVRLSGPLARGVRVAVTLPDNVRPLRLPRGARFERRTRRVLMRVSRLRWTSLRTIRARVVRAARPGDPLELSVVVRAPGDLLPLTDRYVDRGVVGRRTRGTPGPGLFSPGPPVASSTGWPTASAAGPALVCRPGAAGYAASAPAPARSDSTGTAASTGGSAAISAATVPAAAR